MRTKEEIIKRRQVITRSKAKAFNDETEWGFEMYSKTLQLLDWVLQDKEQSIKRRFYKRICKKCGENYETIFKNSKICKQCRKSSAGRWDE